MKITKDVRKYAAEQNISEHEALKTEWNRKLASSTSRPRGLHHQNSVAVSLTVEWRRLSERRRRAVTQAKPGQGFPSPRRERAELLGSNDIKAREYTFLLDVRAPLLQHEDYCGCPQTHPQKA